MKQSTVKERAKNTPAESQFLSAAFSGDLEKCRSFLDAGVNPSAVHGGDQRPHSALQQAVCWKHPEICELLLERGADVHHVDDIQNSALHMACKVLNVDIANMLLKNGADFSTPNDQGVTPLDLMVLHFEPKHYPGFVQSMSGSQIKIANQRMFNPVEGFSSNSEVGSIAQKMNSFMAVFHSRLAMVAIDELVETVEIQRLRSAK